MATSRVVYDSDGEEVSSVDGQEFNGDKVSSGESSAEHKNYCKETQSSRPPMRAIKSSRPLWDTKVKKEYNDAGVKVQEQRRNADQSARECKCNEQPLGEPQNKRPRRSFEGHTWPFEFRYRVDGLNIATFVRREDTGAE